MMTIEAEATMNESASLMLKLNEESITKTSILRHDLKNHYAYIVSLAKEGKNEDILIKPFTI